MTTNSPSAEDLLDDYRSMPLIRRFEAAGESALRDGPDRWLLPPLYRPECRPFCGERATMIMIDHHRFSPRTILQQQCSECGLGQIFQGAFRMNRRCPVCGYKFERGPGYFTGAMYFSYALEIPIIAAGVILGKLLLAPPGRSTGSSWRSGSLLCRSLRRCSATRASSLSTSTATSTRRVREIERRASGPRRL